HAPFGKSVSLLGASQIAFEDDPQSHETEIAVTTSAGKTRRVLCPGGRLPDEERKRIVAAAERFLQQATQ
ncbi:MAG: hypothetical protein M3N24_09940, partial [Actinomycetota bacterium]|nr:hypothetical protein [Actinomycetota bacterium]